MSDCNPSKNKQQDSDHKNTVIISRCVFADDLPKLKQERGRSAVSYTYMKSGTKYHYINLENLENTKTWQEMENNIV